MTLTIGAAVTAGAAAGLCILPPRQDGSKRPDVPTWEVFKSRRPTIPELTRWYGNGRTGIGALMGAVSGNLELFEFDDGATYAAYVEAAIGLGLGPLIARIADGLSEETPGGGYHWYYRCATIGGNTKLAERPGPPDDQGRPSRQVLIETRGEGGYAVLAPSHGTVHQSGKPYVRLAGSFATIATITPAERDALWQLARSFNAIAPRDEPAAAPAPPRQAGDALRPGDDFAARAAWSDILAPHGWTLVHRSGAKEFWRRPDKDTGWSATTNYADSGLLYVFSSSTPFTPERGYNKFGAYAVLNHGGDFAAAAKDLAGQGYGSPHEARQGAKIRLASDDEGDANTTRPQLDAQDEDLPRITRLTWEALMRANDPPRLFRFAGGVARLEEDDQGRLGMLALTEDRLTHELAVAADWVKRRAKSGDTVPAYPPVRVVRNLLASPYAAQPLPILRAFVAAPTFAASGSLLITPGYHAAGRVYYAPVAGLCVPPVSAEPTTAERAAARSLLLDDLLGGFPFTGDAERAHALCALLLPFVRELIDGATPLHLIEKPTAGTGATLLADMLLYPATGRPLTALTEGRDEDEWRKRLTAILRRNPTAVLIDNVSARMDAAPLAAVLTATEHEDRLLGVSETVRIPVRCVWLASGNNPTLSMEISRRTVRVRLDSHEERPWLRQGFRIANLRDWAREHRPRLIWSALTLAQSWLMAGRPGAPSDIPEFGTYEEWRRVLGGILAVAEVPGFLGNLADHYEHADAEGTELRALVEVWWGEHRNLVVNAADLFSLVAMHAIPLDVGRGVEHSQRLRFGHLLNRLRDRRYTLEGGEHVTVSFAGKRRGRQHWSLRLE